MTSYMEDLINNRGYSYDEALAMDEMFRNPRISQDPVMIRGNNGLLFDPGWKLRGTQPITENLPSSGSIIPGSNMNYRASTADDYGLPDKVVTPKRTVIPKKIPQSKKVSPAPNKVAPAPKRVTWATEDESLIEPLAALQYGMGSEGAYGASPVARLNWGMHAEGAYKPTVLPTQPFASSKVPWITQADHGLLLEGAYEPPVWFEPDPGWRTRSNDGYLGTKLPISMAVTTR